MSKRRKILTALFILALVILSFTYGTTDVARTSIQFDLRKIGESIYQAKANSGNWPRTIQDLNGTEYLNMPYRRDALDRGLFVIVWHEDLDTNPGANKDRILAYDNGSMFARLGWIYVCRGDLTIDRVSANDIRALKR